MSILSEKVIMCLGRSIGMGDFRSIGIMGDFRSIGIMGDFLGEVVGPKLYAFGPVYGLYGAGMVHDMTTKKTRIGRCCRLIASAHRIPPTRRLRIQWHPTMQLPGEDEWAEYAIKARLMGELLRVMAHYSEAVA